MNVVRGNQADAEIFRDLRQHRVAPLLFLQSVIVQLDEEILCAKDVTVLRRGRGGLLNIVGLNGGVHFARQAAAQADQSRRMLCEEFLVDPWPVMKTIEMCGRDQFDQIAVADLVLGQQREMISRLPQRARLILVRLWRDISLAPNDWLDAGPLSFLVKLDRAVKISM